MQIITSHNSRPVDMLQRQMAANRSAIRYRNRETGRRHFCHEPIFRAAFIRDIAAIRSEFRTHGKGK